MKHSIICEECFAKFAPKFIHFRIEKIDGLAIYEYDQTIKDLLFTFKGCYDIELKDVFFDRFIWYLKLKYKGYVIVPLPSYYLDDERRGFNHVKEIYSRLGLKIENVLKKVKNVKQASLNREERSKAYENFKIEQPELLQNQKVLIVDDVYTTGSSVKAAIELVKQGNPKKISVLVVSKNKDTSRKR